MSMWKQGSCAEELFEGMQEAEVEAVEADKRHDETIVVQAMEALKAAAESFERAGRTARAKEVTLVMMSLAKDNKKPTSKKKSSKDEAKKVMMFFGFKPEDLKDANLTSDKGGDEE